MAIRLVPIQFGMHAGEWELDVDHRGKVVFLLESLFYSTDEQVTGEDAFAVD